MKNQKQKRKNPSKKLKRNNHQNRKAITILLTIKENLEKMINNRQKIKIEVKYLTKLKIKVAKN